MPRSFNVPPFYRSDNIAVIKRHRQQQDPKKRDASPSLVNFGPISFKIARHFGFCFGVENAIEIAYRAIDENPDKRIFLLSEIIHNPGVNQDLQERGVQFLMNTDASVRIPFSELCADDIVIVPAFGTTLELQEQLQELGIDPYYYDTTCPFVEKVWKRSAELGKDGYTVIVHGKKTHEETRATFSHSKRGSPTLVILDKEEAQFLARFIQGEETIDDFWQRFEGCTSGGFNPESDLKRLGVVNQTTMLATETEEITQIIRQALEVAYGRERLGEHFADTRDTLCYATYENQRATTSLLEDGADIAIVVGGYNSSNTSHLVELFEPVMPVYYVKNASEIISRESIRHFDLSSKSVVESENWLPAKDNLVIALTSGASCPDAIVDGVMQRVLELYPQANSFTQALAPYFADHCNSSEPV